MPGLLIAEPVPDYDDHQDQLELAMEKEHRTWAVGEAKAHLSEVIDAALAEGPQTITRKGRTTVVVVSATEWDRKTKRKGNLAEFFAHSPLRGARIKVERARGKPRRIRL